MSDLRRRGTRSANVLTIRVGDYIKFVSFDGKMHTTDPNLGFEMTWEGGDTYISFETRGQPLWNDDHGRTEYELIEHCVLVGRPEDIQVIRAQR